MGGNAIDASVTLALCQGLMNPGASGVGGGHFSVIRLPDGHSTVINAREMAPAAANETMYVGTPEASLEGGLAVAVPLELKGLKEAHVKHGQLTWKQVVDPVIGIARCVGVCARGGRGVCKGREGCVQGEGGVWRGV